MKNKSASFIKMYTKSLILVRTSKLVNLGILVSADSRLYCSFMRLALQILWQFMRMEFQFNLYLDLCMNLLSWQTFANESAFVA